jgi:hypothetical protein
MDRAQGSVKRLVRGCSNSEGGSDIHPATDGVNERLVFNQERPQSALFVGISIEDLI